MKPLCHVKFSLGEQFRCCLIGQERSVMVLDQERCRMPGCEKLAKIQGTCLGHHQLDVALAISNSVPLHQYFGDHASHGKISLPSIKIPKKESRASFISALQAPLKDTPSKYRRICKKEGCSKCARKGGFWYDDFETADSLL